jgi:hypothetical protein
MFDGVLIYVLVMGVLFEDGHFGSGSLQEIGLYLVFAFHVRVKVQSVDGRVQVSLFLFGFGLLDECVHPDLVMGVVVEFLLVVYADLRA